MAEKKIYPDRIEQARILARFSIKGLSELTGIKEARLAMFESGLATPNQQELDMLCLHLGFTPDFFHEEPIDFPSVDETSLRFH